MYFKIPVSPATRRRACWFLPAKWQPWKAIAKRIAESVVVGDPVPKRPPWARGFQLQFDRVEGFIEKGIAEGAHLVTAVRPP